MGWGVNQEVEAFVCIAGVGLGAKEWFGSSVTCRWKRHCFLLEVYVFKGFGGGGGSVTTR